MFNKKTFLVLLTTCVISINTTQAQPYPNQGSTNSTANNGQVTGVNLVGTFAGNGGGLTNFPRGIVYPEQTNFGAIADGTNANYCGIASSGTTLTRNDNIPWPTNIAGAYIKVTQAGAGGNNDLVTRVAAYISTNQIQLSNAASTTVTNVFCIYGWTDNTAALSNCWCYCLSNNLTCQLTNGTYLVCGAISDPGAFTAHHEAQIYLPTGFTNETTLRILGTSRCYTETTATSNYINLQGSTIVSMVSTTNGRFFDCQNFTTPYWTGGQGYTVKGSGVIIDIRDITLLLPSNPNVTGWNLEGAWGCNLDDLRVWTGFGQFSCVEPTNSLQVGITLPALQNGGTISIKDIHVTGCYNGLGLGEHINVAGTIELDSCYNGLYCTNAGSHPSVLTRVDVDSCINGMMVAANDPCVVSVYFSLEAQQASYWANWLSIINDQGNKLYGIETEPLFQPSTIGNPGITNLGCLNCSVVYIGNNNDTYEALGYPVFIATAGFFTQTNDANRVKILCPSNNSANIFVDQTNNGLEAIAQWATQDGTYINFLASGSGEGDIQMSSAYPFKFQSNGNYTLAQGINYVFTNGIGSSNQYYVPSVTATGWTNSNWFNEYVYYTNGVTNLSVSDASGNTMGLSTNIGFTVVPLNYKAACTNTSTKFAVHGG